MRNVLILLMLLCSPHLFSQAIRQTVRGTVTDRDSQETLVGATVVLLQSDPLIGTVSDIDGRFRLDHVPPGRHTFKISFTGYQDLYLPEVLVTSGKEVVLRAELIRKVFEMKEVKISAAGQDKDKAVNTMAVVSARKLNMDDAARYAGGFYDPARMVSAFAGVAAVEGDGVNDIVIRGNSPRGMLWRLEGIEIPNPNHFTDGQGGTGGAISIIGSHVLATSDFLSGAFPAEYGNALSGVMDLSLRTGNEEKRQYGVQIGVTGTEIGLEGPLVKGQRHSYLVQYRYSTLGLLSQAGLIDLGNNNLPPVFQDLTLNFAFPTRKYGTFSLFGLGGMSHTGTEPVKDSLQWDGNDGRYFETEHHWMGVAGIRHRILLPGNKTTLKTVVATSFQKDKWRDGILNSQYNEQEWSSDNISYPSLRISLQASHRANVRNTLVAGITYSQLYYNLFARESHGHPNSPDTLFDLSGNTSYRQGFLQWKHRFTDQLEMNTGLHLSHMVINKFLSLEPRFGLRWAFAEKNALSLGVGLHSRAESVAAYMAPVSGPEGITGPYNREVGFTRSLQVAAGYDLGFHPDWRMKLEAYYQHLFDVPVTEDPDGTFSAINVSHGIPDVILVNGGLGRNYGLELTVERFYVRNFYSLFTVSLFDSKYSNGKGLWYPTVFGCGYVANVLAGKDFVFGKSRQHTFGLNVKGLLRGGFRMYPIDEAASVQAGKLVFDEAKPYATSLPDFYRIDLGWYFRWNRPHSSWVVSADIQNVIDRKNTLGYEFSKGSIVPVLSNGLIPVLNFRVEF